ncbi:hypothetical protein SBD_4809 [Streptomyces bottropensis ATCC 25435]|uniref:Uncharacterized protein n=1 Tax=Streptomyces bottropensis ATCC 25435 TaxID=1054862 RepID=M3FK17_9ACTN|nr:hypothetical protein SBD_4809 [Streptomyces bottropensis ATCC 25435]
MGSPEGEVDEYVTAFVVDAEHTRRSASASGGRRVRTGFVI